MKNIKLDSILLFALIIPFIMTFRLSPGDTPLWLFGLIFLGMLTYISLDLDFFPFQKHFYTKAKSILLWTLLIGVIGIALYSAIIVRHESSPIYNVHDIILQQEAAVKFLLHGRNPYATTYFDTPLAQWHYSDTDVNPALYHFVMQPLYLLFAVPFYLVMGHTVGFFDARVPLFVLFIWTLFIAWKTVTDEENKRLFITLLALNPALLSYFLEGRDDIFMYAFLITVFYFLKKNKIVGALLFAALAFAVKQSAWPIFPFLFAYLYFKEKNLKKVLIQCIPFAIVFLSIVVPFFLWNPTGFLDSTIFYLSGSTAHSYPVAGYGLGMLLHQWGVIKNVNAYYPFWIWQVFIGVPLLLGLLYWQKKHNSVKTLIIAYGIFLFVFWYLSRYFNNSHLGYLSMVFITAYFWPLEEKEN